MEHLQEKVPTPDGKTDNPDQSNDKNSIINLVNSKDDNAKITGNEKEIYIQ